MRAFERAPGNGNIWSEAVAAAHLESAGIVEEKQIDRLAAFGEFDDHGDGIEAGRRCVSRW